MTLTSSASSSTLSGMIAVFLSSIMDFLEPLRWFCLAAAIIIIVDLRFGIDAAKKRGEKVRFSSAIRRTINKMVDYICWILLAGGFGRAFGTPFGVPELLPAVMLAVIFKIEIDSCFSNYFQSKGKKIKFDIFKWLFKRNQVEVEIENGELKMENEEKENVNGK